MYCSHCGKQSAQDANFCSACGAPTGPRPGYVQDSAIVRPRYPRMIAGVCSGIAIHYGWNVALFRFLTVAFTLLSSGTGVLIYVGAWILLPDAPYALPRPSVVQASVMQPQQRPQGNAI